MKNIKRMDKVADRPWQLGMLHVCPTAYPTLEVIWSSTRQLGSYASTQYNAGNRSTLLGSLRMRSRESTSLILISAASLAYEICLTRIFAIQQFHNFAFIVISLAVMGYAASGFALSLSHQQASPLLLASCYALSATLAYLVINYLPFDSYSIAWDRTQIWVLLVYFLAAGIPFFFAGWFVGQALSTAGSSAYRPYAANLIGGSLGCLIGLSSLHVSSEEGALGISITLGWLAAAWIAQRRKAVYAFILLAVTVCLAFLWPLSELSLHLSPYKPLSIARQFPGARVIRTESNASARVDILESGGIHTFPGLSLNAHTPSFQQIGLFIDGEGPYPITNASPSSEDLVSLATHMPGGLAYLLRPEATALIIDPGTGMSASIALALDAKQVDLPVDQPLIPDLLRGSFSDESGRILDDERIHLIPRSSRGVLSSQNTKYSIVEWALSSPYHPITSGAFSLTENYLLTQDAIELAWRRLDSDGLLVVTRWIGTPPSETARVWTTIVHALNDLNLSDPGHHLAAYRGMRTATVIVSKRAFTTDELHKVRDFLTINAFDPIYLPDLMDVEINQYNKLPKPIYAQLFLDLLEDPEETASNYDFRLEPTTDDRPFFFHFFRWSQSPQVLETLGLIWQPFGGSGYFVLLAMLGLMVLLATPLVILPWVTTLRGQAKRRLPRWFWVYFSALGAGFMLVEIPLITRLSLFLEYPVLSFGVVLFALLLASGVGSMLSRRLSLSASLIMLCGFLFLNIFFLPAIINQGMVLPLWLRVLITVFWLMPVGFLMGIPFASGLRALQTQTPGLIPWAWAINGATSGLSGVLAALALLDLGFRITLGIGLACYALALWTIRTWHDPSGAGSIPNSKQP